MTDAQQTFFDSAALAYNREQIGGMPLEFVHVDQIECSAAELFVQDLKILKNLIR